MTHSRGCVCSGASCWMNRVWWWLMGERQVRYRCLRKMGFKVSSCVNWLHLVTFLTFCHYCHFTWELGQQKGSTDSRLTPDAVHLIDISTDNDLFLHCSGGYIGRRWKGENTGEMSHQGSQRGVKPCLTSTGSVAPLCPLYAPGKMI